MIPPRLQVITVLMFILLLLILIMSAIDHYYWLLMVPFGVLAYDIYYRKFPK